MSTRTTRRSSRGLANGAAAGMVPPVSAASTAGSAKPTKRKASAATKQAGSSEAELEEGLHGRPDPASSMPPPATPRAKRTKIEKSRKEDPAAPSTPTPERAKLMHQPATPAPAPKGKAGTKPAKKGASSGRPVDDDPVSLDRPADPHVTNAPLATPRGSRRVAYPKGGLQPSSYFPKPRTDTAHLLTKACEHLCSVDPRMQILIDAHPCPLFTPEALAEAVDPFKSLVSGILAQQVSGAAAASIRRKFVALFNEGIEDAELHRFPTPQLVVTKELGTLRTAGLSSRKAEYVSGLAEKFVSGELSAEMLLTASWEEVLEKLTAVRGLGVWSVEMFGCFALKRMDIFSTGDLGVQRGLAAFIGRDVKKLKAKGGGKWKYMSEQEMLDHSAKFAPYRTLFMYYMWRVEDVDISSMTSK